MTSTETHITKYRPYYNLCAAIINRAVKDFNKGDTGQRQSAAAFFRGDRCAWMLGAVGANVNDLIKHRLDGDPFDIKGLKKSRRREISPSNIPSEIKFEGMTMSVRDWADYLGVTIGALKARIAKDGVCERSFREMFNNKGQPQEATKP